MQEKRGKMIDSLPAQVRVKLNCPSTKFLQEFRASVFVCTLYAATRRVTCKDFVRVKLHFTPPELRVGE